MRRITAVLVVAALGVPVVRPPAAWACSCAAMTREQAIAEAAAVFVGAPLERRDAPNGDDVVTGWRFRVERVVKGPIPGDAIVWTSGPPKAEPGFQATDSCGGRGFVLGRRYEVFAWQDERGWSASTSICSPTRALDPAAPAPPGVPLAADAPVARAGPSLPIALAAAGAVALLGLGGVWLAYRRGS